MPKPKKRKLSIKAILIVLGIILLSILFLCSRIIKNKTARYIYSNTSEVPCNKVGLLLGTSKYIHGHEPNPFFDNRIKATISLYKADKIKYIIVSGDNRLMSYNEPMTMKRELVRKGIPGKKIFLDYAGFRTFDSVIRCREVFGQNSFTVISQRFHLERAIYVAHQYGIGAIGFEAENVDFLMGLKTSIREYFARVKVFWDYYTNETPKFLGEKIIIP